MQLAAELLAVFSGRVEERYGSYLIEIPESEVRNGDIEPGASYRVALVDGPAERRSDAGSRAEPDVEPDRDRPPRHATEQMVSEGEELDVHVEDLGEQGDGIARVGRGFVIFVPGAEPGDGPTIRVTHVADTYAFGEVVSGADDSRTPIRSSG